MMILHHILITYFAISVMFVHDRCNLGNEKYILCIIQIQMIH